MALQILPTFQSAIGDDSADTAAGRITPSRWNAGMTATATAARVVGTPAASTTVGELTLGSGLQITGSVLAADGTFTNRAFFDDNQGFQFGVGSAAILGNSAVNIINFYTANALALSLGGDQSIASSSFLQTWNGTATPAGGDGTKPMVKVGTAGVGIFWGSGAPTLSAPQGSLYMRTDGSSTTTRMYVNTNGSTGWTNVTTAT